METKAADPVLVVDDDEINLEVAVEEVRLQGYSALVARDGLAAVDAVRAGRLRLVLMDCQMPRMDGFAASRAIRKWEQGTELRVPIVALTSHVDDRERQKARAAGMDDFLTKPLEASELLRVLEQFPGGLYAVEQPLPPPDLTPGVRRSPRLIQLFLENVPAQLAALERAAADLDCETLGTEAHKLKGSCLAIAAPPMARMAEAVRADAAQGRVNDAKERVAALRVRFSSIETLIQWELRALSAG